MEQSLHDAAFTGDINALKKLLQADQTLIQKICVHRSIDKNPIHIGAMLGHVDFVNEILQGYPHNSALSYAMCLARDQDGRNPVHLAAIYGQMNILELVINHDGLMQAALEKADCGGTILHLCVKYNQVKALSYLLQIFTDPHFVGVKNDEGMTILHLASYYNHNQRREDVIRIIKEKAPGIVNIKCATELTRVKEVIQKSSPTKDKRGWINSIFLTSDAGRRTKGDHFLVNFEESKNTVIIVASLIATMAFEAMINPPGGFWPDSSPGKVGISVMALTQASNYKNLARSNSVAFVASLTTIVMLLVRERPTNNTKAQIFNTMMLLLSVGAIIMSVVSISVSYATAYVSISPKSLRHYTSHGQTAMIVLTVWCLPVASVVASVLRFYFFRTTKIRFSCGRIVVGSTKSIASSTEAPNELNLMC
ncbi:OLC1v1022040C1 [Oldenlandia corymbosa var. corymbosa]|uniref:OLC1v1022040C1 n=1 Tax=Oldenlandia corymbosa var. corymbosa TaxID=529605 RepID=A0AAV1BWZ4_OLDCO|nr:OLC1v1022040C1 [Oldenlandia corymbosa var. corymbosa]